jgi:hypothetical protein
MMKMKKKNQTVEKAKLRIISDNPAEVAEFDVDAGLLQLAMVKSVSEGRKFGDWLSDLLADVTADMPPRGLSPAAKKRMGIVA